MSDPKLRWWERWLWEPLAHGSGITFGLCEKLPGGGRVPRVFLTAGTLVGWDQIRRYFMVYFHTRRRSFDVMLPIWSRPIFSTRRRNPPLPTRPVDLETVMQSNDTYRAPEEDPRD